MKTEQEQFYQIYEEYLEKDLLKSEAEKSPPKSQSSYRSCSRRSKKLATKMATSIGYPIIWTFHIGRFVFLFATATYISSQFLKNTKEKLE